MVSDMTDIIAGTEKLTRVVSGVKIMVSDDGVESVKYWC